MPTLHHPVSRHAIGIVEDLERSLQPSPRSSPRSLLVSDPPPGFSKRIETRTAQHTNTAHDTSSPSKGLVSPDQHRSKDQNIAEVPVELPRVRINNPSEPSVTNVDHSSATLRWPAVDTPTLPVGLVEENGCTLKLSYSLELQQVEGVETVELNSEEVLTACQRKDWKTVFSGPETQTKVDLLRPGRVYAVRVRCSLDCTGLRCTVEDVDPSKAILFRTVPTVPGIPQAPALASRSRNALKLKWNSPEETGGEVINGYVLHGCPPPSGSENEQQVEGFVEVYKGLERTFKVAKLQPGIRYTFRVQASNKLGHGPWSLCSAFTTQPSVPTAPAAPQQATCSSDSVSLTWQAPEDNGSAITGFTLERDDGNGGDFQLVYAGLALTTTIKNLQSGRQYRVRLRADNDEGRSNWSPTAVVTTAATVPASPNQVTLISIQRNTATICWQAPAEDGGSRVVGYTVQLQPKTRFAATHMGADWLTIFEGDANACAVNALAAGCTYLLRVRARNSAGYGQFSVPTAITTMPDVPEPPIHLTVASRKSHSLSLTWQAPDHDGGTQIAGYRLEMASMPCSCGGVCSGQLHSHQPQGFRVAYSGEASSATVEGLTPGAMYAFRVHAVNSQGMSQWSETVTESTRAAPPAAPQAPWAVRIEANSLALQWHESLSQGAPITGYTVEMARSLSNQDSSAGGMPVGNGHANGYGPAASVARQGRVNGGSSSSSNIVSSAGTASPSNGHSTSNGGAANGKAPADEDLDSDQPCMSDSGSVADHASSSHSSSAPHTKLHFLTVYQGLERQAEVRNLEPASEYLFRLKAHNALGSSAWSENVALTTGSTAPSAPIGLKAAATSSETLELDWSPPQRDYGSPVTMYIVELCNARGKSQQVWTRVWQGCTTHCIIGSLHPGRSCLLRVRAVNAKGVGPAGDVAAVQTLAAPPTAPTKIAFSNRTANGVRVRWAEPEFENGSPVSSYVLEVAPVGGSWVQAYCGPDTQARLQNLLPASQYLVRAAAVNAAGQGHYCTPEAFLTCLAAPSTPEIVSVTALLAPAADGSTAASVPVLALAWTSPPATEATAEPISYEVEAIPCDDAAAGTVRATVGRLQECRLAGVASSRAYSVRVRAVGADGAGHSAWCAAATATTLASPVLVGSRELPGTESEPDSKQEAVQQSTNSKSKKNKRKEKDRGLGVDGGKAQPHKPIPQTVVAKPPPKRGWRQLVSAKTQKLLERSIWAMVIIAVLFAMGFLAFAGGQNQQAGWQQEQAPWRN